MIELSKISKTKFETEATIIVQSLKRCADNLDLEKAVSFFQYFIKQSLATSSFDEESYLRFAAELIEKLKEETHNQDVVILLVNLSRIHSDMTAIYSEKGLNLIIAQAIAESPDYFTTRFNNVMVFDYLYSHYYWRAQQMLVEQGIEPLLSFLKTRLDGQGTKEEEILASILSSFMSIYFSNDKVALEKILIRFRHMKSVEKKVLKLLTQV